MDKDLAVRIGNAARAARRALRLTQEDAAERIGVSVEFYARIERGNSLPSILTFARIAAVLGISADLLLGRQPVVGHAAARSPDWSPGPPDDSPELRRLTRRLRTSGPGVVRVVTLLVKELERSSAVDAGLSVATPSPADSPPADRSDDDSES